MTMRNSLSLVEDLIIIIFVKPETIRLIYPILLQKIFDNIMNRDIPWPKVPEEMSYEAHDVIDK